MKVLQLLCSLSERELNEFNKFISSPYHNENKDLNLLYEDLLIKCLGNHKINIEIKSKFLDKYNWTDAKFRKNLNDLLNLIVYFNSLEFLKHNSLQNSILKYNAALHKEWVNHLNYKKREITKLKEKKYSWTEIDLAFYYIFLKSQIDSNLFPPEESLLIYAEIAQVKKEFLKASDLSSKIDLDNLQQANYVLDKKYFKELSPLKNDVYLLYKKVNDLFGGKEPTELLNKIKSLLVQVNVSTKLKYKILVHCTGYLSTLINKGNLNITSDLFQLYKFGIENSILLIQVYDYRNIAYLACRANEINWALNFVEKYKYELPKEDQESAYSFTKARTLWYAKDWEGVLSTLRNVEYKDMTYTLITKAYIMTCYYELNEDNVLDSFIKAFKVFLRRKRNISKRRKDAFYGFTTVIGDLMKARERNDPKRLIKAREELSKNPSIPNQDWLIKKIEELEADIMPIKK